LPTSHRPFFQGHTTISPPRSGTSRLRWQPQTQGGLGQFYCGDTDIAGNARQESDSGQITPSHSTGNLRAMPSCHVPYFSPPDSSVLNA
jgi:hypothetical protein